MDILESLYKYLSSNDKIRQIVTDKIYPLLLPQDCTLPAIVYAPVVANYDSALQGDKYISTHSEGEEPYRRVVVTLNRK